MIKNKNLRDLSLDELFEIIKNNNFKFDYIEWLRLRYVLIDVIERNSEDNIDENEKC